MFPKKLTPHCGVEVTAVVPHLTIPPVFGIVPGNIPGAVQPTRRCLRQAGLLVFRRQSLELYLFRIVFYRGHDQLFRVYDKT